MLRDPQIDLDPAAARWKWRRRQLWVLVLTAAALLGAVLGDGEEVVVALILVGGGAVCWMCARYAEVATISETTGRFLG
jgi:hypothetical protein